MRKHRSDLQLGALPPNPRDLPLFFRQNCTNANLFFEGDGVLRRPLPFRPLNRSLGVLPSIALSRPPQVGLV